MDAPADSPLRRYTIFGVLALACGYLAWRDQNLLWAWLGVSFLAVLVAYAGVGPQLFSKRRNGTIALWAVVLWLPYFLLTWGIWYLGRLVRRRVHSHEIVPGLWLGAWPDTIRKLPPNTTLIVDLTAEFFRRIHNTNYLCLPTLDADSPTLEALNIAVAAIQASPGPIYVHCAAGHGRSATVVAAVLIARGLAQDLDDAEKKMQRIRRGVRLTPPQRRLLQNWIADHNEAP
jgi:Dual specificity phosphatase, catalytic domain